MEKEKIDDGGSIHPHKVFVTESIHQGTGQPIGKDIIKPGLTKRDWFAGMALQGMMAANAVLTGLTEEENKLTTAEIAAFRCFEFANAMLKASKGA